MSRRDISECLAYLVENRVNGAAHELTAKPPFFPQPHC